jgi:hypothetical protein
VWNELPIEMRTISDFNVFKRQLKLFYFVSASINPILNSFMDTFCDDVSFSIVLHLRVCDLVLYVQRH